ncbi:hypothetical protein G7Z17_g3647 [Cylindrodendrum hubeiense]|uniref:Protein kinase domain-containing protein n=1 Tax=Cylindrodendrum hubeiense TaxID=595255 RepID=A0A9P5HKP5_9HYPO|nr:hypothetical protein G7Z17_g3647 [Cylindrodendrum hubeiense]
MIELAIGATGLAIEAVNSSIHVLQFTYQLIADARRFGSDVASLRTRLAVETARLQYLSQYLKEKSDSTTPKFEMLPTSVQSAILGLIQELDIQFAAYSNFVAKHKVAELQGGYARSFEHGLNDKLDEKRSIEIESLNIGATITDRFTWGLFEKKRVFRLVDGIKEWNDRLMSLLFCGLCFGQKSPPTTPAEDTAVKGLGLSGGLSLRALIAAQDQADNSPRRNWINELSLRLELSSSDARVGTLFRSSPAGSGESERIRVFIEMKPFALRRRAFQPSQAVIQRINRLADLLAHASGPDAGFRTLRCIGVVRLPAPTTAYAYTFELPEGDFGTGAGDATAPYTLLNALQRSGIGGRSGPCRPTLSERFAMARALALTVFQLHSVNWLHKSIRSENVLIPWRKSSQAPETEVPMTECDYARPVLVGFEFAREEGDVSTLEQDSQPGRNVYRHPDRQGPPDSRFSAQHDAYALGVVLLEIGLWQPAIHIDVKFTTDVDGNTMDPDAIKRTLGKHAKLRLPHYMGDDYADAVLACLWGPLRATQERAAGVERRIPKCNACRAIWIYLRP